MTQEKENNLLASLMQMVNENGLEAVAETFRILLNEAMKIERDQSLGAGLYERTDNRQGYANGYKPKSVDTRMGRLMVNVPQVRGIHLPKLVYRRGLDAEFIRRWERPDLRLTDKSTLFEPSVHSGL